MTTDPTGRHRWVAAGFTDQVRAAEAAGAWDRPSPVAEWTARDVVGHLTGWLPGFLANVAGIQLPPGPAVADDPVGAWLTQADAVQVLLDDPATTARELVDPRMGRRPLPEAIDQFYTADVFMHTWDLGRAAGQEVHLDERWCEELFDGMRQMEHVLRDSGHYGPPVEVPAEARAQDRLIGFIGRDPFWRTP